MQGRRAAGAIYVVDDDPAVLSSLRFLFETEGYRVLTFADGAELVAGALPGPGDCLLIDYKLGATDGLDLARRLRALGVAAPVLLITIYEGMERKAAAAGVTEIVQKPHLQENIVSRVEAVMAAARAERKPAGD